jgi:large subunit ribosomal protein L25
MTEVFTFNAQVREKVGKGASRAVRRDNLVPATVYGDKKEPVSVSLNPKELMSQLVKKTAYSNIYQIDVNGKKEEVLLRNVQFHAVTDRAIHADFLRVGPKTVTRMSVPVVLINHAKCQGLKLGGILNTIVHSLEVACNPKSAPKQITVDLAEARIGSVIKIEDIELPKGVKTYYPKGYAIASINAPAEDDSKKQEGTK